MTWTKEPERFTLDLLHQMPGLNIYTVFRKVTFSLQPANETAEK
jgi:hypothetical protein